MQHHSRHPHVGRCVALARAMHAYLRCRNANNRHPDVIAAQRRERARVRGEHHHRWADQQKPKPPNQPGSSSRSAR